MTDVKNILLVGVGGQGTILASKILAAGLIHAGYDVKMSEIHGMSQRGGSVSTQVRFGTEVSSPIIGLGQADVLVAFEQMEALRYLDYLKPAGKMVVNAYQIPSAPILAGQQEYPQGILALLQDTVETTVVKAATIAEELGNPKSMNVVLFGALVKALGIPDVDWAGAVQSVVKPATVAVNIKAFQAGLEA
jgi:indolepyruvate ferredoxin oxidoreductase beta subunit